MPTKAEVVEVFKRLGKVPTTTQINLYTKKPWSVLMENVQFTYRTRLEARDKKITELQSQLADYNNDDTVVITRNGFIGLFDVIKQYFKKG